jgi:hypothetical protein
MCLFPTSVALPPTSRSLFVLGPRISKGGTQLFPLVVGQEEKPRLDHSYSPASLRSPREFGISLLPTYPE